MNAKLPPAATGLHPKYEVEIGENAPPMTMAELQKQQSTPGRSWMDLFGSPAAKPLESPIGKTNCPLA